MWLVETQVVGKQLTLVRVLTTKEADQCRQYCRLALRKYDSRFIKHTRQHQRVSEEMQVSCSGGVSHYSVDGNGHDGHDDDDGDGDDDDNDSCRSLVFMGRYGGAGLGW